MHRSALKPKQFQAPDEIQPWKEEDSHNVLLCLEPQSSAKTIQKAGNDHISPHGYNRIPTIDKRQYDFFASLRKYQHYKAHQIIKHDINFIEKNKKHIQQESQPSRHPFHSLNVSKYFIQESDCMESSMMGFEPLKSNFMMYYEQDKERKHNRIKNIHSFVNYQMQRKAYKKKRSSSNPQNSVKNQAENGYKKMIKLKSALQRKKSQASYQKKKQILSHTDNLALVGNFTRSNRIMHEKDPVKKQGNQTSSSVRRRFNSNSQTTKKLPSEENLNFTTTTGIEKQKTTQHNIRFSYTAHKNRNNMKVLNIHERSINQE